MAEQAVGQLENGAAESIVWAPLGKDGDSIERLSRCESVYTLNLNAYPLESRKGRLSLDRNLRNRLIA